MGMEGRDTRLINVQWRRRYTRISRLNTSGTVERRITRVPYAGVKFREIKNSEYTHLRDIRGIQGAGGFLHGEQLFPSIPFPVSFGARQFGPLAVGEVIALICREWRKIREGIESLKFFPIILDRLKIIREILPFTN